MVEEINPDSVVTSSLSWEGEEDGAPSPVADAPYPYIVLESFILVYNKLLEMAYALPQKDEDVLVIPRDQFEELSESLRDFTAQMASNLGIDLEAVTVPQEEKPEAPFYVA